MGWAMQRRGGEGRGEQRGGGGPVRTSHIHIRDELSHS